VLTKDWYHNPDDVLERLEKLLKGIDISDDSEAEEEEPAQTVTPVVQENSRAPTTYPPVQKGISDSKPAQTPAEPALPVPAATAGSTRRFEFVSGPSRKFWEISTSNNSFTVRFGRLGTTGQSQTKSFNDDSSAKREAESLIAQKLNKGYVEKNG
jgi:predicted DNA-binding WGR domain protein